MNNDALHRMIADRQARRDKLRGQVDALDVEIKVLLEAVARMGGISSASTAGSHQKAARHEGKERALKAEWAMALQHIGKLGTASLDDIMAWSDANGAGIKRNTLRSQMSIYTDRRWLERVVDGKYRLTDEGATKCGYVPEARNDETDLDATQVGLSSEGDTLFRDPAQAA